MSLQSKVAGFAKNLLDLALKPFGYVCVREQDVADFYLHEYESYDQYKDVQVFHNIRKINNVWADKVTLDRLANDLLMRFDKSEIKGICHGTRNGFEQNYLRSASTKFDVIGTDISETAEDYENSVQWDFHNRKQEWEGAFDFVYTNSLDQAWQPKEAVLTWLSQLHAGGVLVIEHTVGHGPSGASEMDPFGVRPTVMPYVLTMWFGSQIAISHSVAKKENNNLDAWLFVVSKNVDKVVALDGSGNKI